MKRSELTEIITETVRAELKTSLRKFLRAQIPILVRDIIDETVDNKMRKILESVRPPQPNLTENVRPGAEPAWPTMGSGPVTSAGVAGLDRATLTEMLGYGGQPSIGINGTGETTGTPAKNMLTSTIDSAGNVIPINPAAVPESIDKALNTDYRSFMKKLNTKAGAAGRLSG